MTGLSALSRYPAFFWTVTGLLSVTLFSNYLVFSAAERLLLRPFASLQRLEDTFVVFSSDRVSLEQLGLSGPTVVDLSQSEIFEKVGASITLPVTVRTREESFAEEINSGWITQDFLSILEFRTLLGREILKEDIEHASNVVLLSKNFWEQNYSSSIDVLNQVIEVDGMPYEVIGVTEDTPDAHAKLVGSEVRMWIPVTAGYSMRFGPASLGDFPLVDRALRTIGRVSAGTTVSKLKERLTILSEILRAEPGELRNSEEWTLDAIPFRRFLIEDVQKPLILLVACAALLSLVTCLTVGSLFSLRALSRDFELSIRKSLGASPGRLVRSIVVEGTVLIALATILGLLFSVIHTKIGFLASSIPGSFSEGRGVSIIPVLLTTSAIGTFLFGSLLFVHRSVISSKCLPFLRSGRKTRIFLPTLAFAIALSVVLASGLAIIGQSLRHSTTGYPGYSRENLLTLKILLPRTRYKFSQAQSVFRTLRAQIEALPGVRSVGEISQLPLSGGENLGNAYFLSKEGSSSANSVVVDIRFVDPSYFSSIGAELVSGRVFGDQDNSQNPLVVIVDDEFVRLFSRNKSVVGEQVSVISPSLPQTVIGVIKHQRLHRPQTSGPPQVFVPLPQIPSLSRYFVIKTERESDPTITSGVRRIVREFDPDLPVTDIATMEARFRQALQGELTVFALLGLFSSLSILTTAASFVSALLILQKRRHSELLIRAAVGASPWQLWWETARRSVIWTGSGLLVGLLLAPALCQYLAVYLNPGISPKDSQPYILGCLLVLFVVSAACIIPLLRIRELSIAEVLRSG